MEFFNRKEDVMDIELTPLGEILLSQGGFKPTYYAFFDDGIMYDSNFGGITEAVKESKNRIKEVPRIKTQTNFRSMNKPTTNLPLMPNPDILKKWKSKEEIFAALMGKSDRAATTSDLIGFIKAQKYFTATEQAFLTGPRVLEQDPTTKYFAAPMPLGNSSHDKTNIPAWDIKFWHGDLSNSFGNLTSSVRPFLKVPQLDAYITYKSYKTSAKLPEGQLQNKIRNPEYEILHEDPIIIDEEEELYLDFDEDFLIIEIEEDNAPYLKENFEIEVFEIEEQNNATNTEEKEILKAKYFIKPPKNLKNDLLVSFEEQQPAHEEEPDIDSANVEYYFEILTDNEINKELMCQLKPINLDKNRFISDQFDCEKIKSKKISATNIYGAEEKNTSLPDCE
jgi:hypothetical protein